MRRVCKCCGVSKPESAFRIHQTTSGPWQAIQCRDCGNEKQRKYSRTPAARKAKFWAHLLYRYGLTQERYETLTREQEGRCAICRKKLTYPFTDHNHSTGEVRGLLCGPCNMYIGHIREKPEVLDRAKKYLTKKL